MMGIEKNVVTIEKPVVLRHSGKYLLIEGFFKGCTITIAVCNCPHTSTHILRKVNPGYEFRTGEMINQLLFMDDLKLYSKNENALDSLSRQ